MKTVTTDTFDEEVAGDKPVVAYFSATWCGPCKLFKPRVAAMAEARDDVTVLAIDVDDARDLAERFGVMSVPTVVGVVNGDEQSRMTGGVSNDTLNEFVDELVN